MTTILDTNGQQNYFSYLLRLWRVTAAGKMTWRASLENPHSGEVLAFANLEALFVFLCIHTGRKPGSEDSRGSEGCARERR